MSRRSIARRVLSLIDLTDLGDRTTADAVRTLCDAATTEFGSVAAVCVWPRFVTTALDVLRDGPVRIATVVNFPSGDEGDQVTAAQTRLAVDGGADEIDVVIPYRRLIDGDDDAVVDTVAAVVEAAQGAHVKAILETGELPDQAMVRRAAELAISGGADFIKTSTGKTPVSASPEAVHTMLEVIRRTTRSVGLKPSGGIRTLDQAAVYLHLADEVMGEDWVSPSTFRFGASSLLDEVLGALRSDGTFWP
ncbi:MAG TPA: deoxyribose-phosphate aldolase [Ilumatobacteraceae bacterium]|nr:deoxyribose-phosphate aldolase [Ilumatobacteraceae bacterium]